MSTITITQPELTALLTRASAVSAAVLGEQATQETNMQTPRVDIIATHPVSGKARPATRREIAAEATCRSCGFDVPTGELSEDRRPLFSGCCRACRSAVRS